MAASPPLVSVCVITYQHGPFIEQALRSAIEQDYRPLEVVVADDGSTDGTFETVCALARKHADHGGHDVVRAADQFATLALVEAEHPEFAADCASGRENLHYAHGRHLLGLGQVTDARLRLRAGIASCPQRSWRSVAALIVSHLPEAARRRLLGTGRAG